MKQLLPFIILICLTTGINFQAKSQIITDNPYPYVRSIGIHAGTQGLGVTFSIPFDNKLALRAGVGFLPFDTDVFQTYNSYDTKSDIKARFSNVHLLADWTPFYANERFMKHFAVSAGAGYFFKAKGTFVTALTDPYYYGDIEVAPEEVGTVTTTIDWDFSLAPYLGLGLQNFNLSQKLILDINLGTYYLNEPNVSIQGTNLLEGNESNAQLIQNNVKDYRFLPVVQLGLSYKIK